jgi:hypothetical protein
MFGWEIKGAPGLAGGISTLMLKLIMIIGSSHFQRWHILMHPLKLSLFEVPHSKVK